MTMPQFDASALAGTEAAGPVAIARFVQSLGKCHAVQPCVPPKPPVDAENGRHVRQPCRPGGFSSRCEERCRHSHVLVHVCRGQ